MVDSDIRGRGICRRRGLVDPGSSAVALLYAYFVNKGFMNRSITNHLVAKRLEQEREHRHLN